MNLKEYRHQNVEIQLKGEDAPLLGRVEEATYGGLILKQKGSPRAILIESSQIQSIELDERPVPVLASRLQWPRLSSVRKHLSTHHGYKLSEVNASTNEAAMTVHNIIHASHAAGDLGHYHPGQEGPGEPHSNRGSGRDGYGDAN